MILDSLLNSCFVNAEQVYPIRHIQRKGRIGFRVAQVVQCEDEHPSVANVHLCAFCEAGFCKHSANVGQKANGDSALIERAL